MKIKYIMVILAVSILFMGCEDAAEPIQLDETDLLTAGPIVVEESTEKESTEEKNIMVFVCGEVNSPGVYEMDGDARVCDAILMAGDFTGDADIDYLNQAAGLTDGQQLYVPSEEETAAGIPDGNTADPGGSGNHFGSGNSSGNGLVNINTASLQELKTLPGIGDVKAGAIISYREQNGKFTSTEDIKQVDGIKSGLYDSIKDMITVN